MPILKKSSYTIKDIYALPEGERAELIDGRIYTSDAGVREYWIVDPEKERTTIYYYEQDEAPMISLFTQMIQSGIYEGLEINISELLKQIAFCNNKWNVQIRKIQNVAVKRKFQN